MRLLFNHYYYIVNQQLLPMAEQLGFIGNLSFKLCKYLKLKGRPIHPSRTYISSKEFRKLHSFALHLVNDPVTLSKVINAPVQ